MHSRKGKSCTAVRSDEKAVRNSPADTKARQGGGQGAPGAGVDIPHGEDHGGAAISLQPMKKIRVKLIF